VFVASILNGWGRLIDQLTRNANLYLHWFFTVVNGVFYLWSEVFTYATTNWTKKNAHGLIQAKVESA
jgi:hypothetical protein